MAELLIRAGAKDAALVREILQGDPAHRPHRLVVDAHVAAAEPSMSAAARGAGVPFIVDPQTHFLQDVQHAADPWANLPFATAPAGTVSDLLDRRRLDWLAAEVVQYQLASGATRIVAPYVHIERKDDGWADVQIAMWRATRRYLDQEGLSLPLTAVTALGWRLLDRTAWPDALDPLLRGLQRLDPDEVALAASKVDAGASPEGRLASFIAVARRLGRTHPVLAWQQGTLGEAAVAAGATGYECGIGWRERCDLRTAMGSHRRPSTGGNARPVYIASLKRAIPKRSVQLLLENHRIAAGLVCLDVSCCPGGRRNLLHDSRAHAIRARLRGLQSVAGTAQPAWRWNLLARDASDGLELVGRINRLADEVHGLTRVDDSALRAVFAVAEHRRQVLGRRPAA